MIDNGQRLWADIPGVYTGWVGVADGEIAIPASRPKAGTREGQLGPSAGELEPFTFVLDRSQWDDRVHRFLYAPAA